VRVQFHWESEPSYASEASCWIRCAQSLAGPGFGAQFIPRVGMEVVVEFLEGNPDRPLITGCVYDGDNAPPFALPDEKTKSGWRTRSVPGPEGHHELSFEDTAGAEVVHLRSQKDLDVLVLANASHSIGNDESVSVGHDQTVTVSNDRKLTVGANHHEVVADNRTMTVGKNVAMTVGQNLAMTVGQNLAITVGANRNDAVARDSAFEAENAAWKARTNAALSSGKKMMIDAGDKLGIVAAADMSIEGKAKAEFKAADKLTLTCGDASIVLESNGDITINGKKLTLKGSGDIVMKANKVKSN
jgi:type VI secretion system secreted protein VgrG